MTQKQLQHLWSVLAVILLAACAHPTAAPEPTSQPAAPSPTRSPAPSLTPSLTPIPAAEEPGTADHRIGVRYVSEAGEFFDRLTGETFIPRGFNYIRLAPMSGPRSDLWHSTLNPGLYEPERAGQALKAMRDLGYNVVRIFIDCCRPGSNAGDPHGGVSLPYLENVIDFLSQAKANQIYVLMVMDLTPAQGGYDEMWTQCCTLFDGENLRYLTVGGHTGERRFNQDFIRSLIASGAPVEAIFAYDLTNEVHFSVDKPPFSLASGKVTTANGVTYDMADPQVKQTMMDENLVYWIDRERDAILEVDPTALVTVSFPAINLGETTVNPAPAILESTADFVDLHVYLGWGLSFSQYMGRFGVVGPTGKPLILGEFGADRRGFFEAVEAAEALVDLQAESCRYGFDGWLLWTWDSDEQPGLWNGMSDGGVIGQALAPLNNPNPCFTTASIPPVESAALPPLVTFDLTPEPAPVVRSGWTSFTSGHGVQDFAFDQNGNVWTANYGGVTQWRQDDTYTKYAWEHGLAANPVTTITVAPDGAVWFGTYGGGVSRFDGQGWQTFTAADGLAGDFVMSSAATPDGSLWFGTLFSGIARFDGLSWTTFSYGATPGFEARGPVIDITAATEGGVWAVAYGGGIAFFDGSEWKSFENEDGMLADGTYYALASLGDELWAGALTPDRQAALVHFDGQAWASHIALASHVKGQIRAVAVGADGTAWLSTGEDVLSFDGSSWQTLKIPGVESITIWTDGMPWFGTNQQGILIYSERNIMVLSNNDPWAPKFVMDIAFDPDGDPWFGGRGGVAHFDGKSWVSSTLEDGLPDEDTNCLVLDAAGAVWVCTHHGAARFFEGTWTSFTSANSGLVNDDVQAIAIDDQGQVWFATLGGAARFDGQAWETYTSADGLADDYVYSVAVNNQGALWFGTGEGISRLDGNGWTTFTEEDGLYNINPGSLNISPDGTVWVGRINGLAHFDGGGWNVLQVGNGLDSPSVESIAFAPDGSLWCSLRSIGFHPSYGAGRFDGQDWDFYTVADGLGAMEVTAIAVAPDGAVWFGTFLGGVSRFEQ